MAGSLIGGIAETQEMLDFCAEHHVRPEIELYMINGVEFSKRHTSQRLQPCSGRFALQTRNRTK